MSETIFAGAQTQSPEPAPESNEERTEAELAYIGEGRKYSSVEEADKGIHYANEHIKKLEEENAAMRDRLAEAKTIDQLLEKLPGRAGYEGDADEDSHQAPNSGDTEQLQELVNKAVSTALTSTEKEKVRVANANTVVSKLREKYGEKAENFFETRMRDLGVDLNELAMSSPAAAMELLGLSSQQPAPRTYNEGSVNTQAMASVSKGPGVGTYDYWKQQYKEGKVTREVMIRNQHKSLEAMGPDAFYK